MQTSSALSCTVIFFARCTSHTQQVLLLQVHRWEAVVVMQGLSVACDTCPTSMSSWVCRKSFIVFVTSLCSSEGSRSVSLSSNSALRPPPPPTVPAPPSEPNRMAPTLPSAPPHEPYWMAPSLPARPSWMVWPCSCRSHRILMSNTVPEMRCVWWCQRCFGSDAFRDALVAPLCTESS